MFWRRKNKNFDREVVEVREEQQQMPQQQQQHHFDARRIFSDTIMMFAHPWDVPPDIKAKHPVYTGWDAATSDLNDDEMKGMRLKMSALNDLMMALLFRPVEIDRNGLKIMSRDMQAEDLALLRLKKSRYGRILQLAISTITEHRYVSKESGGGGGGGEGKRRWRFF